MLVCPLVVFLGCALAGLTGGLIIKLIGLSKWTGRGRVGLAGGIEWIQRTTRQVAIIAFSVSKGNPWVWIHCSKWHTKWACTWPWGIHLPTRLPPNPRQIDFTARFIYFLRDDWHLKSFFDVLGHFGEVRSLAVLSGAIFEHLVCLPFTRKIRKLRMECKWKDYFFLPEQENGNSWKVLRNSQTQFRNEKYMFHLLGFTSSRPLA